MRKLHYTHTQHTHEMSASEARAALEAAEQNAEKRRKEALRAAFWQNLRWLFLLPAFLWVVFFCIVLCIKLYMALIGG